MNKGRLLYFAAAVLLVTLLGTGIALAEGSGPALDWWIIAGGGAPSGGAGVSLNDTLGQPIIGPSGGGDVALGAGYWANCVAAPAVAPVVTVTRDHPNVVLSWDPDSANASYQVWISTDPYFDPDDPGSVTPVLTDDPEYTDYGAAADPENHFYVVRGVNACAAASTDSGRTGECTFTLVPGN